jgi:hypothetical protein
MTGKGTVRAPNCSQWNMGGSEKLLQSMVLSDLRLVQTFLFINFFVQTLSFVSNASATKNSTPVIVGKGDLVLSPLV